MTSTLYPNLCSAASDGIIHATCSHGHTMNRGCLGIGAYIPNCMNEDKVFNEETQTIGFLDDGWLPRWKKS